METSGFICQIYHYMIVLQLQVILVARMISSSYRGPQQSKNQQRDALQSLNLPAILVYALHEEDVLLIQAHFGIIGRKPTQIYVEPPPLRTVELSPRRHLQIGLLPESHNLHKYSPKLSAPGFLLTNIDPKFYYVLWTMHRSTELVSWLEEIGVVAAAVGPHYDEVERKISPNLISFVFATDRQLIYLPTPPRSLQYIAGTSGEVRLAVKSRMFRKDDSLFPKRIAPLYLGMDDKNARLGPAAATLNQQDINRAINALNSATKDRANVSSSRYQPFSPAPSTNSGQKSYAAASRSATSVKQHVTGYHNLNTDADSSDDEDQMHKQNPDYETPPRQYSAQRQSSLFDESPMQLSQASSTSGSSVSAATSCTASQVIRRGPPALTRAKEQPQSLDARLDVLFSNPGLQNVVHHPRPEQQKPADVNTDQDQIPQTQDMAMVIALLSNPATLAAVLQALAITPTPLPTSPQPPAAPTLSQPTNNSTVGTQRVETIATTPQTPHLDNGVSRASEKGVTPVMATDILHTSPADLDQQNTTLLDSTADVLSILPVASAFLNQTNTQPSTSVETNSEQPQLQHEISDSTMRSRVSLPRLAKGSVEASDKKGCQLFERPQTADHTALDKDGSERVSSQSILSVAPSVQSMRPLLQRDEHQNKIATELIPSALTSSNKQRKRRTK